MKKILQLSLIISSFIPVSNAQLNNTGAHIILVGNAVVNGELEIKNTNSGTIINEGTISTSHNLENQSGCTISGNGTYTVTGDWINNGTFNSENSTLTLTGSGNSELTCGGDTVCKLIMNKNSGGTLTLMDNLNINNDLNFLADNNQILLDNYDLTLASSATISSFDNNEFIVTNGNGQLIKNDLNNFIFPVGYDVSTYNPITLNENGTADNIGVRCLEHVQENGSGGAPFTSKVVDVSWELTESVAGGSDLSLTAQWNATDELIGFDRNYCGMGWYSSNSWDLMVGSIGIASGFAPYSFTRSGIDTMGYFAIGGEPVSTKAVLAVDLLIEGAYSGSGLLNDDLRGAGLIPFTEPYSGLGFAQWGFGGGEEITAGVMAVTGNNAITDWVLVEIRDGNNHSTILATKSALIQKDGDIVDLDGISNLSVPGIGAGNYYVAIKHRNHLGVMSANAISLSTSSQGYDFTSSASNTFGGTNGINDLGDGFFGLFSGDFDVNAQVQNTDVTNLIPTIGNSGYLQGDLNMNGQVQNTDLQLKLYPNLGRGQQF